MGIMYKLMKHRKLRMDLNKSTNNTNIKSDRNRFITIEGNIIDTSLPPSTVSVESTECDLTVKTDSNIDKEFTAEHIIQLCKFLAEKSKRNKNLYKQQQSPKKLTKSKQSQFPFQQIEYDDNDDDLVEGKAETETEAKAEGLPLLSKQRLEQQEQHITEDDNDKNNDFELQRTSAVLSTRLSPDINSLNISSNNITITSCALQHHQQQQLQQQHQQQQHIQHIYSHQQQYQQPLEPPPLQCQGKRDILLKIRRQIFERKRLRENGAFEPQALNSLQVWRPW